MNEKHFILATAGHVDHGKSTLVKALTGTDPDRLPEEKARGITIDLGFAELSLAGRDGEQFHVGIVDVPGHEDFVRNMIAGVGSIDLALLVVAADDGWMPQTEEHLQILEYLGVPSAVIALTKTDVGDAEKVDAQIREKLQGTAFDDAQIVRTSINQSSGGTGLEELTRALAEEFSKLPLPRDFGKPRLFVDRAFSLRGIGTVVTGTLTGGTLCSGDTVFVQPNGMSARVRSLQSHGRDVELVGPGTRTAISLPDVTIGTDIKRGDVITTHPFAPSSIVDVLLNRSARLHRAAPIKSAASAYVHHGTTRVAAKIIFAEMHSLSAGESAIAQLRLNSPLSVFVGDRLIVRDASEQSTIAGGIALNIDSTDFRRDRALFASRAVAPNDVALAVWTEVAATDVVEPSRLLERSHFSATEIANALQRLSDHGEIFLDESIGIKTRLWRDLQKRAASFIDAAHRKHPERRGLELTELRVELGSITPAVFEAVVSELCRTVFARNGNMLARRWHLASLPPELKPAADQIRVTLSAKPFDPPARQNIASKNDPALQFLIDNGEVIEIAPEIVLLRENFELMKAKVVEFISTNGPSTASQLREKLESSRRVIIPFLEYLDRSGVTQRTGDLRRLRETKSATVAQS